MSGVIPLLPPLYAFLAWTKTTLLFFAFTFYVIGKSGLFVVSPTTYSRTNKNAGLGYQSDTRLTPRTRRSQPSIQWVPGFFSE